MLCNDAFTSEKPFNDHKLNIKFYFYLTYSVIFNVCLNKSIKQVDIHCLNV